MATQKRYFYWISVILRSGTTIHEIDHQRLINTPTIHQHYVEFKTYECDGTTYIIPLDAIAYMRFWSAQEEIEVNHS